MAGIASGEHTSFEGSELVRELPGTRCPSRWQPDSGRESDTPIHGRDWVSRLWGPEPENPT